jgi:hypothetical protein
VTAIGTFMAYIPSARWKAFLVSTPVPFTIANLSLGAQVGTSHALGLGVLLLFTHLVRWLHHDVRLPAVPAIVVSVAVYVGLGMLLNAIVPKTPLAFWLSLASVVGLGVLLLLLLPHRMEPAYRSRLPVPLKLAAVGAIVALLVVLKNLLGGFMPVFPMVGTVAAYEARHSLWTVGRQVLVTMITIGPMIGLMWLLQHLAGVSMATALAAGWVLFLAILVPVTLAQSRRLKASVGAT